MFLLLLIWEDQQLLKTPLELQNAAFATLACFLISQFNPLLFLPLAGERIRLDLAVGPVAHDHAAPHQEVDPGRGGRGPEVRRGVTAQPCRRVAAGDAPGSVTPHSALLLSLPNPMTRVFL